MQQRILIVSAVFPPEQVTSAFLNYDLAHELAREYDVTVLRPYPSRPIGASFNSTDVEDKSFKTILVESYIHPQSELIGRFRESIDFGRKSVSYIKKHHQDIDFVYNDGWQLFGLYLVARVCKKYGIPYMVPIQDIYPECLYTNKKYPKILKKFINGLLFPIDHYYQKHAACVRTITNEMRDYLSRTRKIDISQFLVVNNWQNDDDFLKNYPEREKDGKLIFAYVGSVNSHANVDLMIQAFADATIPNSELRIYGGGNKKDECVNKVKILGLTNVFFDQVNRSDVAYVQSLADVLILALPGGNGNLCLPSKLTSYLLSGKPVIASVDEDSATARIIWTESCGIVVPPDDVNKLSEAFGLYSRYPMDKKKREGIHGRNYAVNQLSKKANLTKVVESIDMFLRQGI